MNQADLDRYVGARRSESHTGGADDSQTVAASMTDETVDVDAGVVDSGDDDGAAHVFDDALVDGRGEFGRWHGNDRQSDVAGDVVDCCVGLDAAHAVVMGVDRVHGPAEPMCRVSPELPPNRPVTVARTDDGDRLWQKEPRDSPRVGALFRDVRPTRGTRPCR